MHYEVYTDDNYDKEGNSQACIGAYDSLEEAVQLCEKIVSQSVRGCAAPGKSAQKVFLSWCFGGTSAFIRGNEAFSAENYARRLAFISYPSFDSAFHQEALQQRIAEVTHAFRQKNDSGESIRGGRSVRACTEEAEYHAISALNQQALTLEVYRDQVMGMLEELLLSFRENPFDGSALVAALLRDYMIPAVSQYFNELDL